MSKALFVSPHLDDVAFSCGGTLLRLGLAGWEVTVCTVFTASMPEPQGFALRCQTDKDIAPEVDYMRLRRAEDVRCAAIMGSPRLIHWNFPEAPHRGYESPEALFAGMLAGDTIWREIADSLRELVSEIKPDLVFAPQGLGNHVDHLHVIEAIIAAELAKQTCWYRDTPYAIRAPLAAPSPGLPRALYEQAINIDQVLETKIHGCQAYATQIGFQFGGANGVSEKLRAFHAAEAARLNMLGTVETLLVPPDMDVSALQGMSGWEAANKAQGSMHLETDILVSVVILSYNSKQYLPRAVESVLDQVHQPVEIIIVDNASNDGTAGILDHYAAVATIIRLNENTGFARGMNMGYAVAQGAFVVPMNVDAVLSPTFLAEAVRLFEQHADVGVVAPEVFKLYEGDDWRFWSSANQPTARSQLASEGGVVALTRDMRVHVPTHQPADWRSSFKANGACPVIRRQLLEAISNTYGAAPFDPVFDTYGEDVDFAFKAWALGWRTMFARMVQAGHVRSYASPVALVDKRGRLRANLVAERYINAIRHVPNHKLFSILPHALLEDLTMAARQMLKGDTQAWRDVATALVRVGGMWAKLVRFRVLHQTWKHIDFEHNVYCEPTIY